MQWNQPPSVTLSASAASSSSVVQNADLVIVGVFAPPVKDDDDTEEKDEDKDEEVEPIVFTGFAKQLDEELGGALTELAIDNSKAFQNGGSAGSMTPALRIATAGSGGGKTKRYVLLGLGTEGKVSKEGVPPKMEAPSIIKLGGAVASAIHEQKKITTCNVLLPSKITEGISSKSMLTDFSTAYYSGLYVDNRYRTGKKIELKAENVQGVTLYLENNADDDITTIGQEAIATGLAIASGCALTKDIVNAPHNVLNSESLAETARRIASESGGSITCTILGKEECEARGMGAYLGVARGSETEPQFIHLT